MSPQPTVFITVPKYVAITPAKAAAGSSVTTIGSTALPKIRPAPAKTLEPEKSNGIQTPGIETQAPRGKKRRLDHLTWEEKVQRKKLKNRVAAQTSRDRKKARMEEMEHEIQEVTEKTEILINKCESLQVINDSLLEKNNKLDMEVDQLRQQLQEIQEQQQQQQKTATCAGSGIIPQELSASTRDNRRVEDEGTVEKECNSVVAVACNSSMSSLQDMLLPDLKFDEEALDDAEFDAGKLEELAESLLADIAADLETSDRASSASDAEITSGTVRLLGSMVGSTTECLESSEHKPIYNDKSLECDITKSTSKQAVSNTISVQTPDIVLENKFVIETNADIKHSTQTSNNENTKTTTETAAPVGVSTVVRETSSPAPITPDTVYGTYDAKTNSITIVMDDVAVPVSEAVEEICSDGADDCSTDEDVCPRGMTSPSHVYLNVSSYSDDETDFDNDVNFNFDPIEKFLCPKRPLVSPLAKSPTPSLNYASDHGYESIIGSPSPPSYHFEPLDTEMSSDAFSLWPPGFNELFPSLI